MKYNGLYIIMATVIAFALLLTGCGSVRQTEEDVAQEEAVEQVEVVEVEQSGEEEVAAQVNMGSDGEALEMAEDGTFTEAPEDNTTTTQPPVEQTTPVQQNPTPANNGGSGSGGSGSNSGSGSNGGSGRTGSVVINGQTVTGVRYFDSVDQLNGVAPTKTNEKVSVGGVPYAWNGYEWIDYSGFSTAVEVHDLGEWDGTYVGN